MSIRDNLTALSQTLPAGCTLIAVSKTQPPARIQEAYEWGQRVFGENRAQEMAAKHDALPRDVQWHMIGHLQTNKVKYIAPYVSLIHSVDSLKLLEEIDRQGRKCDRVIPCLLQVHIADEETKFGFSPDEVPDVLASLSKAGLQHIRIEGLMGMATFTDDAGQVRTEFRTLKALFDRLRATEKPYATSLRHLSMGMSADYRIAVEEGSTMVRIGTAIFGERTTV